VEKFSTRDGPTVAILATVGPLFVDFHKRSTCCFVDRGQNGHGSTCCFVDRGQNDYGQNPVKLPTVVKMTTVP